MSLYFKFKRSGPPVLGDTNWGKRSFLGFFFDENSSLINKRTQNSENSAHFKTPKSSFYKKKF